MSRFLSSFRSICPLPFGGPTCSWNQTYPKWNSFLLLSPNLFLLQYSPSKWHHYLSNCTDQRLRNYAGHFSLFHLVRENSVFLLYSEYFWHHLFGTFSPTKQSISVFIDIDWVSYRFNSVLILCLWRYHQISQIMDSVPQDSPISDASHKSRLLSVLLTDWL